MKYIRKLKISTELAEAAIALRLTKPTSVTGLPADGKIVGCEWLPEYGIICLLIETSESGPDDITPVYHQQVPAEVGVMA